MQYVKPLNLFQHLIKAKSGQRGRLLGLDVGDKYVGLAVSDIDNKIACPLSVLFRDAKNMDLMANDFKSLISQLSLVGFIVGYPYDKQKLARDAIQVKLFIDDLSNTGKLDGVKYTFWDEGFTSKNVELLLKPLNMHPTSSKTIADKFAAVQILQFSLASDETMGHDNFLIYRTELFYFIAYLDYANKKEKLGAAG
ncbi:Resolvase, holliday junction-type, YqgF-like protein [Corchorus capsularis]|uniref:Resolvase, holliday junction-type, YqgF-like protein n=1 Tax=Corchorus capsularis TaxID=210143 RepID=A0A1R3IAA8_COCAP|nr:Resolvase, holliday junction-type, YqgF-like protein [Corchorus capsularis]